MKRIATIVAAWSIVAVSLLAVPAAPYPIQVTQPDGTALTLRQVGDETGSYYILADGTPVRKNTAGYWAADSTVVPTSEEVALRRVQRKKQIGGGFPLTGSPRALVLLVGFSDLPFAQSLDDFKAQLNESGYSYNGATGSCRDFFIASSDSLFSPQFDAYGPFTASQTMAYYGAPSGDYHDSHPQELIIEACQAAEAAGVDFSQYDTNGDGILDNVFVYYAGHNQAEGGGENTIWPHQSNLLSYNVTVSGVRLATYACTSEYRGSSGTTRAPIGTFCHEFGHVLGLPDFYDTDYKYYTVGNWDVMCDGSYNNAGRTPPVYSSYERFYLGWLTPAQLTEKGTYYLEPLETSNKAYLLATGEHNLQGANPNPSEFFMLEYRANTAWDEPSGALPGTGLVVWHIDYSATAWNNNTPNNGSTLSDGTTIIRMHLEEANGVTWQKRTWSENGRSSDSYPGTQNVTTFVPKLHDGTALTQQHLFNIAENNGLLSFTYIAAGDAQLTADKESLSLVTTMSDANKIVNWTPQSVQLTGSKLDTETPLTISVSGNFYVALADKAPARGNAAWKKSTTLEVSADSTISETLWVCFNPTKQNCTALTSVVSISGTGVSLSLPVSGLASRPKYITTPVVNPTSQITPYSFRISWKPQSDAGEYYISLYSASEGTSSFLQSFENFESADAVRTEGWESTTNTTTTSAKSNGTRSLYLKNTGDCVTTEEYPFPITEISFWVNAFTSSQDTVGYVDLEAWNGKKWVALSKRTNILALTKNSTITQEFSADLQYTRFRLTYTDKGASGAALDAFTAVCSKDVEYLYRGHELTITAVDDADYTISNITDLTPQTTYYYRVSCSDLGVGCEEYISDWSEPTEVTTFAGVSADDSKHLTIATDSVNFDEPTCVVYLPSPANNNYLYIFDTAGHLVYSCKTYLGQSIYTIPVDNMVRSNIYILKYVEEDKLGRKQRWVKFLPR